MCGESGNWRRDMEDASNFVAARGFARSLNILLKTVRLYGADHERTTALLGTAWDELRAALKLAGEAGLLLGVSGGQVLLDGVPLDKGPSDRSFARLLTSAGLASIHFSPHVTVDDLWRFVRAFSSRSPKAGPMVAELKAALGGDKGAIRVNEVRFVAQDPSLLDAGMAAQLAARSLGADGQKLQALLQNPQRLLQLIAAAEGARSQSAGPVAPAHRPTGPERRGQRHNPRKRTMSSRFCNGWRSSARRRSNRIHPSKSPPSKRISINCLRRGRQH